MTKGVTGTVNGVTSGLSGLLGSLLGTHKKAVPNRTGSQRSGDETGAFGLTEKQEKSMMSQLLGGGQ